ncbi:MAG: NAD(P)-dependent oxidoreductase [Kiritimatiellia bacterium]|nr:NAD(P)-dependent oxidoreductase [Kiritimatiellia bacterium]
MPERLNILVAESADFNPSARAQLESVGNVVFADLDRDALISSLAQTDVLWVRLRNHIDKAVLDAAPRLKVLVTPTTGFTHIDMDEVERRGIHLVCLAGETEFLKSIRATAELTLALTLALLRQVPASTAHVQSGQWDRDQFKGRELYNKTVGVLGYGRLGHIVAPVFQAFGSRVLVSDPNVSVADPGVELVPLDQLLAESDIVTLHVNFIPQNRECFSRACFDAMKDGAWLINTARGELVDEEALLAALKSGRLAGAALDVLQEEQTLDEGSRLNHPLIRYARESGRLLITPHIGGCTWESMETTELFMVDKLKAWIETTCLDS